MRTLAIALLLAGLAEDAAAQTRPRVIPGHGAMSVEAAVKRATEMMSIVKKTMERDLAVLLHLRNADAALRDPMQPVNAVTKALEEVEAAKSLEPEFLVMQGVLRILDELESARRSPGSADFPRLRSILRDDALDPASRLAQARARKAEADAGLAQAQGRRASAEAAYQRLTGKPAGDLAPLPELPPVPPTLDQALDMARASNPALRQAKAGVDVARAGVRSAKAEGMPTVGAFAEA
ncbi:MAG: TolC family protein, partial [Thermoanaerobaculia bacterium]